MSVGTTKVEGEITRNMEHVKDLEQCKKQYASDTGRTCSKSWGSIHAVFAETIAKWNSRYREVWI